MILHDDEVLLIRRGQDPFEGHWALPGGFVEYGERVEEAARREAEEETSLPVRLTGLLGVYSAPDRDPRHHTVSVAFLAAPQDPARRHEVHGKSDADAARWFPLDDLPSLAFDHERILQDAKARLGPI